MTAHANFASYIFWYLVVQTSLGLILKTHIWQESRLRRALVLFHGFIGKSFPVVGWVQMVFGGIAVQGFCFNDHFVQCLAHTMVSPAEL